MKRILLLFILLSIKSFGQLTYRINLEAGSLGCGCSSAGAENFYAYDASNNVIPSINFNADNYPSISFETLIKPSKIVQVLGCEPTGDDFCYPFPYSEVSQVILDNASSCEYKTASQPFGLRVNVQTIGNINNIGCVTSNLTCSGSIERWEVRKPGSNVYEIIPNSNVNTLTKTYNQIYSDNSGINKTTYFRAKFTGTQVYTYHPFIFVFCSPNLDNTSDPNITYCNYTNGEVIFTFSRPLEIGEKYLFSRNPVGQSIVTSSSSDDVANVEKISATVFKWKNIPPGTYEFKYQTQFENNTASSVSPTTFFTITPKEKLNFTVTAIQPLCNNDNGSIQVSATGGTAPYFYVLDNESLANRHSFSGVYIIPDELSVGDHTVIVVDSHDCIEK
jgi:SprB repeat